VFVIVEENHGYADVIGNPAAPNLNALAQQYGLATDYSAVTHPSEPNYVAMLGGSPYAATNDNAYYVNSVNAPSLISQLDAAKVSWKGYFQGLPHAGYQGICYPASCNGAPDKDPLYVSKHNPILNFTTSWNDADRSRQVPMEQLHDDLAGGKVPAFNYVVPDECHDEHGDPPYCLDSGNVGGTDPQDQRLVATGDQYLGNLVHEITGASFWGKGNNAIDIVYDEGDYGDGTAGGRVADVVVTSHGPRGLQDPTPYSHYSLLATVQRNFGLGCLQHSCDTGLHTMDPLLAPAGAPATAFRPVAVPSYATPSPVLPEPITQVTDTPSKAGWTVQAAPYVGTGDNTFGAVSAVSANDVWAVGNYMPDTANSNQDATLATAAHFDGTRWTTTPTADSGPNFNTLFGVAALPGKAFAVGVALDDDFHARSMAQIWNGSSWQLSPVARPAGSRLDSLRSVTAVSANDVWAVGEQQGKDGRFATLVEHYDGTRWSVVDSANPGATGNQLYGVSAAGPNDVWAVGQRNDLTDDRPLVEHWDGHRWSAVEVPTAGTTGAVLQSVATQDGQVWAAGQSDDAVHQGRPFFEHLVNGGWQAELATDLAAPFSDVTGITLAGRTAWAVGTYFDAVGGTQLTLVARNDGDGWHQVAAPNPGTGDQVLGGVSAAGGSVWAVGYDKVTAGRSPLIERH
jgi:hypothetical protein